MSESDPAAAPRKRRPAAAADGGRPPADSAAPPPKPRRSRAAGSKPTAADTPPTLAAPVAERPTDEPHHARALDPSRLSILIVAILAGSALFLGGFSLGARTATTPGTPASQEARFAAFWDTYSAITKDFAGTTRPNGDQLVQAAIKGMMESLNDPFSYYQSPDDFASNVLSVGGRAIGIGVTVQMQPILATGGPADCQKAGNGCELAIIEPFPGSPAESAGIKPGDVIAAVDGKPIDGLTLDAIIASIKGDAGTAVTLTIQRESARIDVRIVRNTFNLPEIDSKSLDNGRVAYIHIEGINDIAGSQFDLAVANAMAGGAKAFILDLRGNGGGYVGSAVQMASEFIPSGTILYQQDAAGTQTEIDASPGGRATDPAIKVVVLVDKGSASSSEILSGALQTRGRAKLIGTTTYGKGVVQEWLPLPNNDGGIHLTIARWLLPNKVWIQGKGLTPDVAATMDGARAGSDPVLDAGLIALGYPAESAPNPSTTATPGATASPSPSPAAS
jgi:carboxyl-terminal processing protease